MKYTLTFLDGGHARVSQSPAFYIRACVLLVAEPRGGGLRRRHARVCCRFQILWRLEFRPSRSKAFLEKKKIVYFFPATYARLRLLTAAYAPPPPGGKKAILLFCPKLRVAPRVACALVAKTKPIGRVN